MFHFVKEGQRKTKHSRQESLHGAPKLFEGETFILTSYLPLSCNLDKSFNYASIKGEEKPTRIYFQSE